MPDLTFKNEDGTASNEPRLVYAEGETAPTPAAPATPEETAADESVLQRVEDAVKNVIEGEPNA